MEMAQRQRPTAPARPDPSPTSVRPEAPPVTRVFATGYVDEASRTALSASGVKVEGFRPDHLEAALPEDAARCALLWQDPVEAAATAMETGRNLNEVTGAWLTNAREVLAVFRRNRRRLLLVDTRLLTPRATEAEREALCSRLQIKTLTIATKEPDGPARQMARMLAGLVLPQIPALRRCLDELEASSLPVAPETPSVGDLTAAADLFKHIAEQAARVDDLGKENALLKTRAGLQQEEAGHLLEEHRFAGLALEKSLARALADLRTEARARVKLQEEHDSLREKHRLANLAAEEALARTTADLRAGEEARAKLQAERDGLREKHRLANLAAEKALARATADLRTGEEARAKLQAERDGLREKHRLANLAAEKALARATADLRTGEEAQAKLQAERDGLREKHRLANLAAEKALARATADLRAGEEARAKLQAERDGLREKHQLASLAAEKALARATADLRAGEEARAKLQAERDGLVERLHQIFASTSWRVTRPLRMLKLRLVGGLPPADQALAETIARHPAARNNAADGK